MVPVDGWHRQPPEHVMFADTVSVNRYCPAAQSDLPVHVVAPSHAVYVPEPQAVHDASAVCPFAAPYLPAPQAVHDASADPPV